MKTALMLGLGGAAVAIAVAVALLPTPGSRPRSSGTEPTNRSHAANVEAQDAETQEVASPRAFENLLQSLSSARRDERSGATLALATLGPGAIPRLVEALQDNRVGRRQGAVLAFEALGPEALPALPHLIALLEERSWNEETLRALQAIGPKASAAIPALCRIVTDDPATEVIRCIGSFGPHASSAVPALVQILSEHPLSDDAVGALAAIGPAGAPALPALRRCLAEGDTALRRRALEAIGALGAAGEPALPDIRAKLHDPALGRAALQALGAVAPLDVARPDVVAAIRQDPNERYWTLATILSAYGSAAVPLLVEALDEETALPRSIAVSALATMGAAAAPAVEQLTEALDEPELRTEALVALRNIGRPARSAVPAIIEHLRNDDDVLRQFDAVRTLKKLDPAALSGLVPHLIARLSEPEEEDEEESILEEVVVTSTPPPGWNWDEAVSMEAAPRPYLVGPLLSRRNAAAKGIAEIGPAAAAAVPQLAARLRDPETRIAAADALAAIGRPVPGAVAYLLEQLGQGDTERRATTLRAIAELTPHQEGAFIEALRDPDDEVRAAAAECLGRVPILSPDSIAALLAALGDSEPVAHAACDALGTSERLPDEAAPALLTFARTWTHPGVVTALKRLGPAGKDSVAREVRSIETGEGTLPDRLLLLALERCDLDLGQAVALLRWGLQYPDRRADAIRALAWIGPPAAAARPDLERIRDNESLPHSVRRAAAKALRSP